MKKKFKEIDFEGMKTLEAISKADKFNKWMFETIKPYCSGNILEIGSGIGNISQFFIENNQNITLSDIRKNYLDYLIQNYKISKFLLLDLVDKDFDSKFGHLFNTFDTIFALNVIEHIEDHELAIKNCYKLLKNNGNFVILVPAYSFLYNNFDINLGHYRRYNIKSLSSLLKSSSLKLIHKQYFNFIGILGWFVFGNLLKNDVIKTEPMNIYNKFIFFIKLIDRILFNSIGLSVICVGKK